MEFLVGARRGGLDSLCRAPIRFPVAIGRREFWLCAGQELPADFWGVPCGSVLYCDFTLSPRGYLQL